MKVLLIDHYDSFTDILADYLRQLSCSVDIVQTDKINEKTLVNLCPDKVIVGPGPGHPSDVNLLALRDILPVIFESKIPYLGVCLGHQILANYFGAKIITAPIIAHGLRSKLKHRPDVLFESVTEEFSVVRYHSLIVDIDSIKNTMLEVTALTSMNEVMAIRHKNLPCYGVQFHPESVLTEFGLKILDNFVKI